MATQMQRSIRRDLALAGLTLFLLLLATLVLASGFVLSLFGLAP